MRISPWDDTVTQTIDPSLEKDGWGIPTETHVVALLDFESVIVVIEFQEDAVSSWRCVWEG